ncbi:hypothetical protein [Archaeoglobus sp.]
MDWFSLIVALGFTAQAVKLYPKRSLDWLVSTNLAFALGFALASFIDVLRVPIGILTVLAFVKPSFDRSKNLKFRISHLIVLTIALTYTVRWLV